MGVNVAWMRTIRMRERNRSRPGVGEAVQLAVLLAEALHHPHAGDGLVDHARHLAGALLRVPARGEDAGAHAQGDEEQEGMRTFRIGRRRLRPSRTRRSTGRAARRSRSRAVSRNVSRARA